MQLDIVLHGGEKAYSVVITDEVIKAISVMI